MGYDGSGNSTVRQATLIVTASTARSPTDDLTSASLNTTTATSSTHVKSSDETAETKSYLHLVRSTQTNPTSNDAKEEIEKSEKFLQTVNGLETTRKRARDALLRQQAELARERQAIRQQKESMRRTGGGFVVQYSKDI